jgi:hypothetical protein
MRLNRSQIYDRIVGEFEEKGCKLLTTKEEFLSPEDLRQKKLSKMKLRYIALCNHEHNVFYNVFKYQNSCTKCPKCWSRENGLRTKKMYEVNEVSNIYTLENENSIIQKINDKISIIFDVHKAFDGCLVDMMIKPKTITEDKWIGIQVKTTNANCSGYSYHINNSYKNCLILCYTIRDNRLWIFPENIISGITKITIGKKKSKKYGQYEINFDNIIDVLINLYENTSKFEYDVLNTPINIYQKREQDFRKFRESMLPQFEYKCDELEGTEYDFFLNGLKIQEKVCQKNNKGACMFFLQRNQKRCYALGDNDFYWLNSSDKDYFLVIPETILLQKGFLNYTQNGEQVEGKRKTMKVTFRDKLNKQIEWLQPYLFNYNTINEENEKTRLDAMIKQSN